MESAAAGDSRRVTVVADDALGCSDCVELIGRLRSGEVSSTELVRAARERIARANESLNAVAVAVDEPTRADATGTFAGIPFALKDNEDLIGHPTSWGSRALGPRPATADTPITAQLLRLGLDPVVKTTLPEFGLTATTEPVRFGPTRNPWDTGCSTGGSSGGSAALVAAGAVPLAHANDGGGSIRIPASCCGLVGLKPSRGRLVDLPDRERAPINLVAQGVLTRTVRDTALYFAEAERDYRNPELPPVGHVQHPLQQRLRLALMVTGYRDLHFSADVARTAEEAALVCERLGHDVEVVEHGYPDTFGPDFLRYWALLAFGFKRFARFAFPGNFDGTRTETFTDGLAGLLRQQAERLPASLHRLRRFARRHEFLEHRYDAVISPVLGHAPPPIGWLGPDVPFRTHMVRLLRYALATPMHNVSGVPSISLPMGRTESGVPIGVQFSAEIGQEARLLGLALALEEAAPWPLTPG